MDWIKQENSRLRDALAGLMEPLKGELTPENGEKLKKAWEAAVKATKQNLEPLS